jgi:hypothetical protein
MVRPRHGLLTTDRSGSPSVPFLYPSLPNLVQFTPDDGGNMFLRKAGTYLSDYTVSQSRRLQQEPEFVFQAETPNLTSKKKKQKSMLFLFLKEMELSY